MSEEIKAIPPDTIIKMRYTIHHCGVCGNRVAMTDKKCKECGTPINWYKHKKNRNLLYGCN